MKEFMQINGKVIHLFLLFTLLLVCTGCIENPFTDQVILRHEMVEKGYQDQYYEDQMEEQQRQDQMEEQQRQDQMEEQRWQEAQEEQQREERYYDDR